MELKPRVSHRRVAKILDEPSTSPVGSACIPFTRTVSNGEAIRTETRSVLSSAWSAGLTTFTNFSSVDRYTVTTSCATRLPKLSSNSAVMRLKPYLIGTAVPFRNPGAAEIPATVKPLSGFDRRTE